MGIFGVLFVSLFMFFSGVGVNRCGSRLYVASVGDEPPKNIGAIATEHLDSNPLDLLLDVAFFFAEGFGQLSIERFAFEEEFCDFPLGWRKCVSSAEDVELSF